MSQCENCNNNNLLSGFYICDTEHYVVKDSQNNLVFIKYENHGIPSDDIEIGDTTNCQYCNNNNCKYIYFPN